jgi:hypothetical protein
VDETVLSTHCHFADLQVELNSMIRTIERASRQVHDFPVMESGHRAGAPADA